MKLLSTLVLFSVLGVTWLCRADDAVSTQNRWPADKANQWYAGEGWLVGCNYCTSTAINQLEMWQADTFDPATIDRELGWAQGLGFTTVRVFLHNLLWTEDSAGFLDRMSQFLKIADKHRVKPIFVFFDSCWARIPNPAGSMTPALLCIIPAGCNLLAATTWIIRSGWMNLNHTLPACSPISVTIRGSRFGPSSTNRII